MAAAFDPVLTRQVNAALGPLFVAPIVSPVASEKFGAAGFSRDDWSERYFAFRSAPLGRATAETVIATYYNFSPARIREYVPRVWDIAEPDVVLDALMDTIDTMTGDALADVKGSSELLELAALLTEASATAFDRPEGRPLFAGIAAIPWPDAPGAQIWLGMHALREFRGDGHVAVLASHGITGLEALVLHGAMGVFPADRLRASRFWPQDEWDVTVDDLRARGLLVADEVRLSEQGTEYRDGIEARTDDLTVPAYASIGEAGVARILELAPPIVELVTQAAGTISREQYERVRGNDA